MAVILLVGTIAIFIFSWRLVARFFILKGKRGFICHILGATTAIFAASAFFIGIGSLYRSNIHNKAWEGNVKAVKSYVEKGGNVNEKREGTSFLSYASGGGNIEIVEFLISKGANVNSGNGGSVTPLHYAAREGHVKIIAFLLSKGAEPNLLAYKYKRSYSEEQSYFPYEGTPIHWAIASKLESTKKEEVVKLLLDSGANPNLTRMGIYQCPTTSLEEASKTGNIAIAKMLVEKGAEVNTGISLHEAVLHNHYEMVKFLLEKGADVNAKRTYEYALERNLSIPLSGRDKTPLQLAKQDDIKELLRKYGGRE